jgi:hypothetical protein
MLTQHNKNKKISLKPTKIEAHLQYICPNQDCGFDHWLTLRETQTRNFKIVCECGTVFRPKRVKDLDIVFAKKTNKAKTVSRPSKPSSQTQKITIPIDILNRSAIVLVGYGFTDNEARQMIQDCFDKTQSVDVSFLVKNSLESLRGKQ